MATGRDASSKTEKQRNREAKRQGSREARKQGYIVLMKGGQGSYEGRRRGGERGGVRVKRKKRNGTEEENRKTENLRKTLFFMNPM